jgi:alpha-D-ribose 1-methylphosphonate 5-triphosphate synthase subunit PhnG
LGAYLEEHHDLLFDALAYAPTLQAKVKERLKQPLTKKQAKARAKAAREVRAPLVPGRDRASLH